MSSIDSLAIFELGAKLFLTTSYSASKALELSGIVAMKIKTQSLNGLLSEPITGFSEFSVGN